MKTTFYFASALGALQKDPFPPVRSGPSNPYPPLFGSVRETTPKNQPSLSRCPQLFHKIEVKSQIFFKRETDRQTSGKAASRPARSEREPDDTQRHSINHKADPKAVPGLFSLDCLKVLPRNRRMLLKESLPQLGIWVL